MFKIICPFTQRYRGFTLLEVLVSIAIIALLLALSLPVLLNVRSGTVQTACQVNIRSAGLLSAVYAADAKDYFPFGGYSRRDVSVGDRAPLVLGGDAGLSIGRWALMFPDQWSGLQWAQSLQCPRQPVFDPAAVFPAPGSIDLPHYWMSGAIWLDAASLTPTSPGLRLRANRFGDVAYPANKVLLYEVFSYCAIPKSTLAAEIQALGQSMLCDVSVLTVDMSVRRTRQADGLPAHVTAPFNHTLNGVLGRDLP